MAVNRLNLAWERRPRASAATQTGESIAADTWGGRFEPTRRAVVQTAGAVMAGVAVAGCGVSARRPAPPWSEPLLSNWGEIARLLTGDVVSATWDKGVLSLKRRGAGAADEEWLDLSASMFDSADASSPASFSGLASKDEVLLRWAGIRYCGTHVSADLELRFDCGHGAARLRRLWIGSPRFSATAEFLPNGPTLAELLNGQGVDAWGVCHGGAVLEIDDGPEVMLAPASSFRITFYLLRPASEDRPWASETMVIRSGVSQPSPSPVGSWRGRLGHGAIADFAICIPWRPGLTASLSELPSLMSEPADRSACVSFRGAGWTVTPFVPSRYRSTDARRDDPGKWRIDFADEAFDSQIIETAWHESDQLHHYAARLNSEVAGRGAHFGPGGGVQDAAGSRLKIDLKDLSYAIAFDSEGHHTAVRAEVPAGPQRFSLNGCVARFCGLPPDPKQRAFELVGLRDRVAYFRCRLRLLEYVPIVEHLIVTPDEQPGSGDVLTIDYGEQSDAGPEEFQLRIYLPQRWHNPDTGREEALPHDAVFRAPARRLSIERAEDLLRLQFAFDNFSYVASVTARPALMPNRVAQPSYWSVIFPPQHLAEEGVDVQTETVAGKERDTLYNKLVPQRLMFCRLADPSRLVFRLRATQPSLPFASVQDLLDWNSPDLFPSLPETFAQEGPQPPRPYETAIEAPFKLVLTPGPQSAWAHSHRLQPAVSQGNGALLWETRLSRRLQQGTVDPVGSGRVLRAVYAWPTESAEPPGDLETTLPTDWNVVERYFAPLVPEDRRDLVELTRTGDRTIDAARMGLTALGANLDLAYDGVPGSGFESWKHRTALGRDNEVRVVRAGVLYPWGFAAAFVRLSRRRVFYDAQTGRPVAYLTIRRFIEIREPLASFNHRTIPAQQCALRIRISPNLREPTDPLLFWPTTLDGNAVQWPIDLTDHAAVTHPTTQALLFVGHGIGSADTFARNLDEVNQTYLMNGKGVRDLPMSGVRVAYAVPDNESTKTAFDTNFISVGAIVSDAAVRQSRARTDPTGSPNAFGDAAVLNLLWLMDYPSNELIAGRNALQTLASSIEGSPDTLLNQARAMANTLLAKVKEKLSVPSLDEAVKQLPRVITDPDLNAPYQVLRQTAAKFLSGLASRAGVIEQTIKGLKNADGELLAAVFAAAIDPQAEESDLAKVRRLVGGLLPGAFTFAEQARAGFVGRIASGELKNVTGTLEHLGLAVDAVGQLLLGRLNDLLGPVLTAYDGTNAHALLAQIAVQIRQRMSAFRLDLYDAFERAKLDIPGDVKRLREQISADEDAWLGRINRRLLEAWAGVKFETYEVAARVALSVTADPDHLLGILATNWAGWAAKVSALRALVDDPTRLWTDQDTATARKAFFDGLRDWLGQADNLLKTAQSFLNKIAALELLPAAEREYHARLKPGYVKLAEDKMREVFGVPEKAKLDELPAIRAKFAEKFRDVVTDTAAQNEANADSVLARTLTLYLFLKARTVSSSGLSSADFEKVRAQLAELGLHLSATYGAVADRCGEWLRLQAKNPPAMKAQLDAQAARLIDALFEQLFGAVLADDLAPLLAKLMPAADDLGKYVAGMLPRNVRNLADEVGKKATDAIAAANRLADGLNTVLANPKLMENAARFLARRALDEAAELIPGEVQNLRDAISNLDTKDTLAALQGWVNDVSEKLKNAQAAAPAAVLELQQIVESARANPVAEDLEQLNRRILAMRFPRAIPRPRDFVPVLEKALVHNPAVAALAEKGKDVEHAIAYADAFVRSGFDAAHNAGEVFGKLVPKAVSDVRRKIGKAQDDLKNQLALADQKVRGYVDKAVQDTIHQFDTLKDQASQALHLNDLDRRLDSAIHGAQTAIDNACQALTGEEQELINRFRTNVLGSLGDTLRDVAGKLPAPFDPSRLSGLALPDMTVSGLSRKFGNVAGELESMARQQLDPLQYFPAAKVLGKLDLKHIIEAALGEVTVPKFLTEFKYPDLGDLADLKARVPEEIRSTLHWTPQVKEFAFFKPMGPVDKTFRMDVATVTTVRTGHTSVSTVSTLNEFAVVIGEFIEVQFERCVFTAGTGQATHCDPKITQVLFKGPLAFVDSLRQKLGDLFGDNFKIDITPSQIAVSLVLAFPPMTFGAFTLQGLRLSAGLVLPMLGGQPLAFRFAFAERASPMVLAVGIFGGTAFFAIELQAGDSTGPGSCVRRIEAALEFGGFLALNLGVAAGSVAVMGGIYYRWTKNAVDFSGYLRITGSLSVFGFITVTVEFLLALTYTREGDASYAEGTASITVRVKIGFFSKSVSLEVHRRFAGSGGSGGATNGASSLPNYGCRTIGQLEAAAQERFDAPRGESIEHEMTPAHFDRYWSAFNFDGV